MILALIRNANPDDLKVISDIAHRTWPVSYRNMISQQQIDYMLGMMYSSESLRKQSIDDGHEFFILSTDGKDVGFASISSETNLRCRLQKLYVLPETQGTGAGKLLLQHVETTLKNRGIEILELTVNKNNPALNFYKKMNFAISNSFVLDIGGGFVMDDYLMEKCLTDFAR